MFLARGRFSTVFANPRIPRAPVNEILQKSSSSGINKVKTKSTKKKSGDPKKKKKLCQLKCNFTLSCIDKIAKDGVGTKERQRAYDIFGTLKMRQVAIQRGHLSECC